MLLYIKYFIALHKAKQFIKKYNLKIIPIQDCVGNDAWMVGYDLYEAGFVVYPCDDDITGVAFLGGWFKKRADAIFFMNNFYHKDLRTLFFLS